MNFPESLYDLIELCLVPYQSKKTIELTQLKLKRSFKKNQHDPLLLQVASFRKALKIIKKLRKLDSTLILQHPLHRSLYQLKIEDLLILLSQQRYAMTDDTLAIILNHPKASLEFRRTQLHEHWVNDGNSLSSLAQISLKELSSLYHSSSTGVTKTALQKFQSLPFSARFTIETLGFIILLVSLMWMIPEARNTYENSVQKRLDQYLIESSLSDAPPAPGTSAEPRKLETPDEPQPSEPSGTQSAAKEIPKKSQPRAQDGETWRFSFTGARVSELESHIEKLIKKESDAERISPVTVPGGIQYDFLLSTQKVIDLKIELEQLTSTLQEKFSTESTQSNPAANMSWYKKKNMRTRTIPKGKVQAVVWISTL